MKTLLLISGLLCVPALHAQESPVSFNDLPSEARTFVTTHFKSPVHHIIKEADKREISYEVVLDNNTELDFDDAGRWKEIDGKGNAVPTGFIQRPIQDYVKTNYARQYIVKIERSATNYEVELKNGIDLIFDTMGTFVKVD